jgi:hypothetical protein
MHEIVINEPLTTATLDLILELLIAINEHGNGEEKPGSYTSYQSNFISE